MRCRWVGKMGIAADEVKRFPPLSDEESVLIGMMTQRSLEIYR